MEYYFFKAETLLSVTSVASIPQSGRDRPEFANLKAKMDLDFLKDQDLAGPGIYGMFCRGQLVYVGIYTGTLGQTFAGTVLDRWAKHITYFGMRNPELSFSPSNIFRINNELADGPCSEILSILSEAGCDLRRPQGFKHALLTGRSCTFNKAKFASQNWDIFKPGQEKIMTSEISFAYGRLTADDANLLGGTSGKYDQYALAKKVWLQPREKSLIQAFNPICNYQTKVPGPVVGPNEFERALREVMACSPSRLAA